MFRKMPLFWVAVCGCTFAAQPSGKAAGIKTPGIQIPFANLKAEAQITKAPSWITFTDGTLVADEKSLYKIDAKKNELGDPVAAVNRACGGAVNAFGSIWVPSCGDGALVRLDPKTWKVTATVAAGVANVAGGLAASADSIWLLTDTKTTLSRIDPEKNEVVAELRLPLGCDNLAFGEGSLWVTCATEDRVLRINPATALMDKRIDVGGQPRALAIGETSVWVWCQKEGKIDRIDPKTNKVSKSIELGAPGADGTLTIGEGSIWTSITGFPINRIDPNKEKVVQQFWGAGGGLIRFGLGSVWLSNLKEGTLWRVDPKRVAATLAE